MNKNKLSSVRINYSWSFSDKTIKDTSYITHGYYTYPAKFIPQLAERLIKENSNEGDIVIDPFMGSGTTVVEAIVNNRIGIGTIINDKCRTLGNNLRKKIYHSNLSSAWDYIMDNIAHILSHRKRCYVCIRLCTSHACDIGVLSIFCK